VHARRALVYFEKDLKVSDEGAATAKRNIALARSMFKMVIITRSY
jgi:hypothetical protein